MIEVQFEWNETKNLANRRKHGVSFEQARQVFRDPRYISVPDRVEDGEQRWQTLGLVENLLLLMVVHLVQEESEEGLPVDLVRIISARRATPAERRLYDEENS